MDHFVSLVVLVCVIVIAVFYSQLHAKARFGKMEIEVKADRKGDKKEKPGHQPDSPSKPKH